MKTIKVGVIGCGSIGEHHVKMYRKLENVEVVACCDVDDRVLSSMKKKYGVAGLHKDYRKVLSDGDLDAVSVCLPNYLHSEVSVAAFEEGKHVLCEKPVAMTVVEAEKMVEAGRKAGRKLLIGFHNRFDMRARILKKRIDSGELGQIYYARCGCLRRVGIPGLGSWFTTKSKAGAGVLFDVGVHALDLTYWLMNNFNPSSVSASTYAKFGPLRRGQGTWGRPVPGGPFDVEDLAVALIRMKNGATVFLEVWWAAHSGEERFYSTLLGEEGGADFESATIYTEEDGNPVNKKLLVERGDTYFHELRHFIDCIVKDKPPTTTSEQILAVQRTLNSALEAAETRRSVTV